LVSRAEPFSGSSPKYFNRCFLLLLWHSPTLSFTYLFNLPNYPLLWRHHFVYKYFVSGFNKSVLNWTCLCQLHFDPIVLNGWQRWDRCPITFAKKEVNLSSYDAFTQTIMKYTHCHCRPW
jgi:hypothetical protein